MANVFDSYAREYREIINSISCIVGEKYEFFIRFRVYRMKHKLISIGAFAGIHRILDLGCGTGASGEILEAEFPQALITGVDSSQESIAQAHKQTLRRTTFLCEEAEALTLEDDSVDLIYSNGFFHHTLPEQRGIVLKELHRVVRPGGQIFIFENNPANPLTMWGMKNNPFDMNAKAITSRQMSALIKGSGFQLLQTAYYFFFPHSLRFLRWSEPTLEWLPFGAQYFIWAVR